MSFLEPVAVQVMEMLFSIKKIYIPDIICLKITFAVSLSYLCVYVDHHFLSFAFIITNNIILRAEIIANHIKKI